MATVARWDEMTPHDAGGPLGGRPQGTMIEDYLQPVAQHVDHPQRLLLRDGQGRWYVWTGERPEDAPAEIPAETAAWLLTQPGLLPLDAPHVWIHPNDLPLLPVDSLRGARRPEPDDAGAEE
jgi:hypothetical protein